MHRYAKQIKPSNTVPLGSIMDPVAISNCEDNGLRLISAISWCVSLCWATSHPAVAGLGYGSGVLCRRSCAGWSRYFLVGPAPREQGYTQSLATTTCLVPYALGRHQSLNPGIWRLGAWSQKGTKSLSRVLEAWRSETMWNLPGL
jgi:hypothetical protein